MRHKLGAIVKASPCGNETMSRAAILLVVAFFSVLPTPEAASQQLARPVTIKAITSSPPRAGLLIQVNGLLLQSPGRAELKSPDTGQKIILDFSQPPTKPEDLTRSGIGDTPVSVIGISLGLREKGMPVVTVLGAFNLTK